ncbi:MAG TPA: response regulator [Methylobacterium sp.]|jgi:DNA-binding response OmpR family regulator|nr:response regulator [Methylobacterium sp.]
MEPDPNPDVLHGQSVLVVEDQYFLAGDIARALAAVGAEVVGPVPDLDRGLALSRSQDLDAAVLDINLRGEDVYRLAEELMRKDVPIVFTTGVDSTVLPAAFVQVPRLEKPIQLSDLIRTLSDLLTGARPAAP